MVLDAIRMALLLLFKFVELFIIIKIFIEEIRKLVFQYDIIQFPESETIELHHEIDEMTFVLLGGKISILITLTLIVGGYIDFFFQLQEMTIVSICINMILWTFGHIIIYIIGSYNYSTEPTL